MLNASCVFLLKVADEEKEFAWRAIHTKRQRIVCTYTLTLSKNGDLLDFPQRTLRLMFRVNGPQDGKCFRCSKVNNKAPALTPRNGAKIPSGPIHTGRAPANSNASPLMLLACSVDTLIQINRFACVTRVRPVWIRSQGWDLFTPSVSRRGM